MKEQVYTDIYNHELHHWWYRVRRTLACSLIETYTNKRLRSDLHILDVGCGTGGLMKDLAQYGIVTGVDMSDEAVAFCKQRGISDVHVGDITRLPFADNSFDVVVALDILEHVDDDTQAARELFRILKPDGIAVVFVPALMIMWGTTDEVGQHKRRYTKTSINRCLRVGGLQVVRSTYFNSLLFLPILVVRLLGRILKRKVVDEFKPGERIGNKLLYAIFSFEVTLLRYMSFPVGVSVLSVCRKKVSRK